MAKKSRRVRKQNRPVRLSQSQLVMPQTLTGSAQAAAAPTPAAVSPTVQQPAVNLAEEYHYVIADLKRIGLIALAMLVLLVVLAFLLT